MNDNETGATEQPLNAPEKTAPKPKDYGTDEIAALYAQQFLKGSETADSKESEIKSTDAESLPEAGEEQQDESSLTADSKEETVAEDEAEPEAEATDEAEDEEDRGLPKGVKKRIDKLTAKRREAEAKLAKMEEEMERLRQEATQKSPAKGPDPLNPYAHLNTPELISKEIEQAKQVRRWCEMNPDGATVKGENGDEVDYTAEEIRQIKLKALDAIEEHLPRQLNYVSAARQVEVIAQNEYPWWKDKSARERQIAEKFIESFPEIQRFPDYKMVVGDYIRGVKAREAAKKGSPVAKAPVQPRPTNSPVTASKDGAIKAVQSRFKATGSTEDLASIIASKFI
jgi:hypothetical protein